ncbi:hypothetical protein MG293_011240 [Ovis ammon polii]|uniref:Uncharacterized protein n=1 Tax=Ovis ammon polii TaxID=230172 RepID=A0AAD4U3V7_OVIAM|nr:hypothetical protein MG293_011240 [Ovis ammon polii]
MKFAKKQSTIEFIAFSNTLPIHLPTNAEGFAQKSPDVVREIKGCDSWGQLVAYPLSSDNKKSINLIFPHNSSPNIKLLYELTYLSLLKYFRGNNMTSVSFFSLSLKINSFGKEIIWDSILSKIEKRPGFDP